MQHVELGWWWCNGDTGEREMTDPCDDGFGWCDQCDCWSSGHMGERVSAVILVVVVVVDYVDDASWWCG